jgi:hypothetical protein
MMAQIHPVAVFVGNSVGSKGNKVGVGEKGRLFCMTFG